jgi:hypothetical protein
VAGQVEHARAQQLRGPGAQPGRALERLAEPVRIEAGEGSQTPAEHRPCLLHQLGGGVRPAAVDAVLHPAVDLVAHVRQTLRQHDVVVRVTQHEALERDDVRHLILDVPAGAPGGGRPGGCLETVHRVQQVVEDRLVRGEQRGP